MTLLPFDPDDGSRAARLFWAVPAGEPVRTAGERVREGMATQSLARKWRWLKPEDWHLTLVFLGDVDVAAGLVSAGLLAPVVAALKPFTVAVSGPSWFPSMQHPLVVALEAESSASLRALSSACGEAMRDAGMPHDPRPFRGHVSLARVRRGFHPRDPLPHVVDATTVLPVREIVLYESVKGEAGRRYLPRVVLPLGG